MSSRLNVELHPFQNVEILTTIFSFCSVDDLKWCRYVSKLWLKESMNSWRENAVLKIVPEVDDYDRIPGIGIRDLRDFYKDKNDPLDLRRKPFKNFRVERFHQLRFNHSEVQLTWIIKNFSEHIRYFAFKDCEFATMTKFMETLIQRLPNIVELKLEGHIKIKSREQYLLSSEYPKHQKLKCITIETHTDRSYYSINFPTLLCGIADLQDLRVKRMEMSRLDDNCKDVMKAVSKVRQQLGPNFLQLKNLEIPSVPLTEIGFISPENFQFESSIPLERFTGTTTNVLYLKPFIETLKFLHLRFTEEEIHVITTGSCFSDDETISLPHVKEFHAHGAPHLVFQNLNKVETSNLETLVVEGDSDAVHKICQIAYINLHNLSFGNVKKLECYHSSMWYIVDSEDIGVLSESMPNVLHLKMAMTRKAFTDICKVWPNLRTLTISQSNAKSRLVDDEAITGFKPESELPEEEGRSANITNLKNLTDFACLNKLTEHSVYFGFLQLPRIHYLHVHFEMISMEAELVLREKVHFLEIEY